MNPESTAPRPRSTITGPSGGEAWLHRMTHGRRFCLILSAAALALLLFSVLRRPFVNEDGALYLMIAQRISIDGLASGMSLFDSPFYSALIAATHAVTGLSLQASAYLLNAAFVVTIALAFTDLCRQLYDDRRIVPWAALVVLAHPKLDNYFSFVVRDIGYWGLLLGSWSLFLRHLHDARLRWLAGWAALSLAAALFKPEGLAFGLVLPLAIVFDRHSLRSRLARTLTANGMLLLAPVLAMLLQRELPFGQVMCCLHERPLASLQGIPQSFLASAEEFASSALHPESRNFAALSLAGGLATLLVARILNTLGVLQALLLLGGWRAGTLSPAPGRRAAYLILLVTAALLPASFLAYQRFLDTRYLMPTCLLLLIPTARVLQVLGEWLGTRAAVVRTTGMLLLFAALATDFTLGLDKSKPYMLESYRWIREHVGPDTRVFTNDRQFAAVALGNDWDLREIESATWMIEQRQVPEVPGRLWIIHVQSRQTALADGLKALQDRLSPVTAFSDERGSELHVYRELPPAVGN